MLLDVLIVDMNMNMNMIEKREKRTGGVEEEKSGAGSIDDHNTVVVLAT